MSGESVEVVCHRSQVHGKGKSRHQGDLHLRKVILNILHCVLRYFLLVQSKLELLLECLGMKTVKKKVSSLTALKTELLKTGPWIVWTNHVKKTALIPALGSPRQLNLSSTSACFAQRIPR